MKHLLNVQAYPVVICIFRSTAAATHDRVSNAIPNISKTQSAPVKPIALLLYGNHLYYRTELNCSSPLYITTGGI